MAAATGSHTMLASQASLNANPAAGNTNNNAWRSDVDTYYDYAFRVCIVGDSGVGKTSLVEKEIGKCEAKEPEPYPAG
jgi:GTPase SAR1 family protein